ncbi:hypothetical protein GIB67_033497 [Kingdonia uniflora]|uniref:CRC domain-containing protein n=1 Tax=Kingdonia uniflora TaxID=39325 RepID=A0A7J7L673_9MAGN|nr:hypothetical protein GIB67_033497 [Kingdonia uniflora]
MPSTKLFKWKPLPVGVTLPSTDESLDRDYGGYRGVASCNSGHIMFGAFVYNGRVDPVTVTQHEMFAMLRGLQKCVEKRILDVHVATDSAQMIEFIKCAKKPSWNCLLIYQAIGGDKDLYLGFNGKFSLRDLMQSTVGFIALVMSCICQLDDSDLYLCILTNYCECFAAGVYCVEPCSCQDCHNKPIHEYTVLATRKQIETRNPLAFAPKVVRTSESIHEIGEESSQTPASARHKRGCNCKKSSCLKKYCECYQGGVGCSINCRCEGCKNAFGKKDGFASMGLEEAQQQEEDESGSSDKNNGSSDKNNTEKSLQYNELGKGEGQYPDPALPVKFSFPICRTSVQLPYPSIGRLTHSSHPPQPKFEKHSHLAPDDETPEILRGNCSPISGVKTVSPNRKRVSPPHGGFEPTPGRRSSRKLILQSIPSFPSLTHHESDDFK